MDTDYKCWFDGATHQKNPASLLGYGTVIKKGDHTIRESCGPMHEHGTNNSSEYRAVIDILDYFENQEGLEITILGDSQLVIKQLSGQWAVKKGVYKTYALEALSKTSILQKSNKISFQWVPREHNKRADELSKLALKLQRSKNYLYELI